MKADASCAFCITKPNQKLYSFGRRYAPERLKDPSCIDRRETLHVASASPTAIDPLVRMAVRLSGVSIFAIIASAIEAPYVFAAKRSRGLTGLSRPIS
jgi:hypothetical protein